MVNCNPNKMSEKTLIECKGWIRKGLISWGYLIRKYKVTGEYAIYMLQALLPFRLREIARQVALRTSKRLYMKYGRRKNLMVKIINGQEEVICVRPDEEAKSICIDYCGHNNRFTLSLTKEEAAQLKTLILKSCNALSLLPEYDMPQYFAPDVKYSKKDRAKVNSRLQHLIH